MAFVAALAPYLAAAGGAYGAVQKYQSDKYNSQVLANEQGAAINQANAQANMQRREGRIAIGKQIAAFGSAGVGYGGSSETSIDQSIVNSELDDLNTKYKGSMQGYGYGVQSKLDSSAANEEAVSGGLLAGAALLKANPSSYYQNSINPS